MLKVWRVIKVYIPLLIELFGGVDVKAIQRAGDKDAKKKELIRQLKEAFGL
jgi:hypothetical protein